MDFRLPGLDGAAATALCSRPARSAAVVCLTAEATEVEDESVLAAGASALIEKGGPDRGSRRGGPGRRTAARR